MRRNRAYVGATVKMRAFLLGICACLAVGTLRAQTSPFQFLQKPGPYAIGLKVVSQYDRSRTFPGSDNKADAAHAGPRPVQTLVWYPSSGSSAAPMTVGDYAHLADTEIRFDRPDPQNSWNTRLAASAAVKLWAVRDAQFAKGRFPVVIYAPGDSSVAWENADLCEYLASHGYVVLASPSMGAATRDMTDDVPGIGTEARDISFLIDYAKTLPDADIGKLAVAGWSWGGIANLFAAARDRRVGALVALDGSMRYYPGLVRDAGDVHPEHMRIPLLFFTRGDLSLEDWDQFHDDGKDGPNVLNAWKQGDLWTVHMLGMSHPEFASMYQRKQGAQRFAENQYGDYGREDANISYAWMTRYVLGFLDAYLKGDTVSMAFLKRMPAENGVPRHFVSVSFRAAGSSP